MDKLINGSRLLLESSKRQSMSTTTVFFFQNYSNPGDHTRQINNNCYITICVM